jgi:ribosomal protein S27E
MNGEIIGMNTAIYSPDGAFSGMGFAIPINQTTDLINQALGNAQNSPQSAVPQMATPVAFFGLSPAAQNQALPAVTKTKQEYLQCPNCGIKINQTIGIPWSNARCPSCGAVMAHVIEQNETIVPNQNASSQVGYHYPNLGKTWPADTSPIQPAAGMGGALCPSQRVAFVPSNPNDLQPTPQMPSQQAAGGGSFCPGQTVAFVPLTQNEPFANNDLLVAGNQQGAPYLGVSLSQTTDGLQVMEVAVNSPAEKYGMKPGDIVTNINQNIIKNIADFDDAMGKIKPGNVIRAIIIRGESKRPLYIKTELTQ